MDNGEVGRSGVEGWLMEKARTPGSTPNRMKSLSIAAVDTAWWIQVPGQPPLASLWYNPRALSVRHGRMPDL